jgi:hypothetical protein
MAQVDEQETTDRVIEEARRIKESLAAAMNFDIDRILEDARNKQQQSGRTVLPPAVRR